MDLLSVVLPKAETADPFKKETEALRDIQARERSRENPKEGDKLQYPNTQKEDVALWCGLVLDVFTFTGVDSPSLGLPFESTGGAFDKAFGDYGELWNLHDSVANPAYDRSLIPADNWRFRGQ